MKVKQLIKVLEDLDQNAIIKIASDEEGNSYGDMTGEVGGGIIKETKEKCYMLYPSNCQLPEELFDYDEEE